MDFQQIICLSTLNTDIPTWEVHNYDVVCIKIILVRAISTKNIARMFNYYKMIKAYTLGVLLLFSPFVYSITEVSVN